MFLWCCPKKKYAQQKNQLSQSLIETDNPSHHIAHQCTLQNKSEEKQKSPYFQQNKQVQKMYESSVDDTRSYPYDSNQITEYRKYKRLNRTQTKQKNINEGVVPSFTKIQSLRSFSPREHQKNLNTSKKSHLWKQQIKSDLIYIDSSCTNFVYMNYRLAKNQETKQFQDGLDYFLSRSQEEIHLIIGKQQVFHKKASVLNKYNFNTISAVINNQSRYTSSFSSQIQAIFVQDLRSIRRSGINSIVIAADFLSNVTQVKEYFDIVFKDLKWQDIKKITYFFPSFMTIQEISKLIFSYIKQNIVNLTLQKLSLDLCFDMELIEGSNLDSCIIIKNRSEEAKQSNAIYDHIKLSIIFFEKELSDATQRIFIDFYIQSKQKSLKEYFEMKQFYKKNPSQFQLRMKKIKDMDSKFFSDLDNSPPLKQVRCEQSGIYFMISSKFREDIGKLYNIPELQKKEVDTPMKKEWDDDASNNFLTIAADDFKTTKKSSLDMVAKEELDKIDLDMGLGDDSQEERIYDQNQDNIILNVEETKKSKYEGQN